MIGKFQVSGKLILEKLHAIESTKRKNNYMQISITCRAQCKCIFQFSCNLLTCLIIKEDYNVNFTNLGNSDSIEVIAPHLSGIRDVFFSCSLITSKDCEEYTCLITVALKIKKTHYWQLLYLINTIYDFGWGFQIHQKNFALSSFSTKKIFCGGPVSSLRIKNKLFQK